MTPNVFHILFFTKSIFIRVTYTNMYLAYLYYLPMHTYVYYLCHVKLLKFLQKDGKKTLKIHTSLHNFFRNEKHVFISGLWKIFTRSPFLSTPEKYWKYNVDVPFKITHLRTYFSNDFDFSSTISREIFFLLMTYHWNFNW